MPFLASTVNTGSVLWLCLSAGLASIPGRHSAKSGDIFALHTYGDATDIQWAEVRDPAGHPVHRSPATAKSLVPTIHTAEMGNRGPGYRARWGQIRFPVLS